MKKAITESQLRNIIAESIKKCLDEYHSTPNTPKPIGNQKAAPIDDRMRKMNEGLFGPSKKQIAAQQAARQAERDRKQAEWDEWQKANSDRIASQTQQQKQQQNAAALENAWKQSVSEREHSNQEVGIVKIVENEITPRYFSVYAVRYVRQEQRNHSYSYDNKPVRYVIQIEELKSASNISFPRQTKIVYDTETLDSRGYNYAPIKVEGDNSLAEYAKALLAVCGQFDSRRMGANPTIINQLRGQYCYRIGTLQKV